MSISQVNGQERARGAAAVAALRASGTYAPNANAPTRQPDSISISHEARALAAAHTAVSSATDVRAERVAELRAAIANGSYSVDSRQLARALVDRLGAR
jgi:negative regulator of flagellin synthesis FlgM